jgi:aldose 1-epimerase
MEGFPGEVVSYVTYTLGNSTSQTLSHLPTILTALVTWDFKMVALATTKKTPILLSSHVLTPLLPLTTHMRMC